MIDHRVDELRQQLRALGYLDAGVDRFVLGGARERRGPVGTALRTSLRVGLLGGTLLGPAAAIGVSARLPGLVSGMRDAAVIALDLAVLFAIAVATAAFVVSLAAAAARARQAPQGAAWIFVVGSLSYLTLWWRNANAGFGWSAPAWTAFALMVAVAISLLLGHAVRIATVATMAARGSAGTLPPVPSRSWRVVLAGGAVAFAGAAILLLATLRIDAGAAAAAPPLTVVNSRAPILLVALDGFDPATYERLSDRLPTLRAFFGGANVRVQPQDTSDPARAWTTIATGMPPREHGVHALETRRVAGLSGALTDSGRLRVIGAATDLLRLTRPSLASAQDRRVKTIWEIANQAGLRTAVVNWWATWPAPPGGGVIVTDRGVLRLERGGSLDGEIAPPQLYDTLRAAWPDLRKRAAASASAAFSRIGDPEVTSTLVRSAELDLTVIALLRAIPPPRRDLDVVYLPGLDIAQNTLLTSAHPASASSVGLRVAALDRYYSFLDAAIAPLLNEHDKAVVMVLTQPGRVQSSGGGMFAVRPGHQDGTGDSDSDNLGTARAGVVRAQPPRAEDVAPTVLDALGLPLSRELPGRALTELTGATSNAPERFVSTYGKPSVAPVVNPGRPLDQETIDRLRSLGYIK